MSKTWTQLSVALTFLMFAMTAGCFSPAKPKPGVEFRPPPEAEQPPPPVQHVLSSDLRAEALHELVSDANAGDAHIRANALEALRDAAPDEAADPAINGLTDPDARVRFAACMAVGELQLKDAHHQLLQMHEANAPDVVQVGVRFALHRLGDTRYSHDLETYARDADPEIRGKTALVLGLLEEPSATVILRPMRRDSSAAVRLQVAESLWRLGDQEGLDDLVGYAISGYPDDLILATLALAAPKDQRVIQHVRANLTADYPEVNLAAARALGQLGSDEGFTIAMKGAHSQDPRQRLLGALALGAIGRSDAEGVLSELMKDSSPTVRLAAATAVLQLH